MFKKKYIYIYKLPSDNDGEVMKRVEVLANSSKDAHKQLDKLLGSLSDLFECIISEIIVNKYV